jgi:hypothetical protein
MKFVTREQFLDLKEWAFKLGHQMGEFDRLVCRSLEEGNASDEIDGSDASETADDLVHRHLYQLSLACAAYPRDTVDLWAARWIGYNSTLALPYPVDLEQYRQDIDDLEQLWESGRSPDLRPKSNSEETEELLSKWLPGMDVAEIRNTTIEQEKNQQRLDQLLPPYSNWKFFSSRAVLGCDEGASPIVSIPEDIALPAAFQRFYDSARHALDCIIEILRLGGVPYLMTEYSRWVKPLVKREVDAFASLNGELITNATVAQLNESIGDFVIKNVVTPSLPGKNHNEIGALLTDPSSAPMEQKETAVPAAELLGDGIPETPINTLESKTSTAKSSKTRTRVSRFKQYSLSTLDEIPASDRSKLIGISDAAKILYPDIPDRAVTDLLLAGCKNQSYRIYVVSMENIIFNMSSFKIKLSQDQLRQLLPNDSADANSLPSV